MDFLLLIILVQKECIIFRMRLYRGINFVQSNTGELILFIIKNSLPILTTHINNVQIKHEFPAFRIWGTQQKVTVSSLPNYTCLHVWMCQWIHQCIFNLYSVLLCLIYISVRESCAIFLYSYINYIHQLVSKTFTARISCLQFCIFL